jgi:wobble nucleotide-excising tRNase
MSNCEDRNEPEFQPENQAEWIKEHKKINKLKAEIAVIEAEMVSWKKIIVEQNEIIKQLSDSHYHIAKENNRMLYRILEEMDAMGILYNNFRKKNEN